MGSARRLAPGECVEARLFLCDQSGVIRSAKLRKNSSARNMKPPRLQSH
jgi:hypothetical protein